MRKSAKAFVTFFIIFFATNNCPAQQNDLSVKNIFSSKSFRTDSLLSGVQWIPNQNAFTYLETDEESKSKNLWRCDAATGECELFVRHEKINIIESSKTDKRFTLPPYSWAPDGFHLLIPAKNDLYILNTKTSKLDQLTDDEEKERDPQFSFDSKKIAYLKNNNLVVLDITTKTEKALTTEGNDNILMGRFDWLYEEEFGIRTGFEWSPDSKSIAYFRLDQSGEPDFPIADFVSLRNDIRVMKYPKAGDPNALVKIGIVDITFGKTVWINRQAGPDDYFSRIEWSDDSRVLSVTSLNRDQNHLELLFADPESGHTKVVLQESIKNGWLEVDRSPHFIKGRNEFIWLSENDGYNHLYLYDKQGKLKKQITKGKWDVRNIVRVVPEQKKVYFTASPERREETHLFVVSFNGRGLKQLTKQHGTHSINMSPTGNFYINSFSNFQTPTRQILFSKKGKLIKSLREGKVNALENHRLANIEFFSFRTSYKDELPAFIIKPVHFNPNKKYPVLIYTYGGPCSQIVNNKWFDSRGFWYTLLTQKGYLIFAVDGRGAANRGRDWKHKLYKHLGDIEIQDQVEGAKYLQTLPFVDESRIGIWGWSYGGYTSIMCMLKGVDHFKVGVSVAPVTDWRNYNSIYTERFMDQPEENEDRYNDASTINHAKKLKGKLLLIHGSADDNVHFSNTMQLVEAFQKHRKPFDLMIYPRKKHSIRGVDARVHLYKLMTDYILANL